MVLRLPNSWSNWNLEMLFFEETGKPQYPEKNLSEQRREPTTNSTHIWRRRRDLNPGHICGRRVLSPLRHPKMELIVPCVIRLATAGKSLLVHRPCLHLETFSTEIVRTGVLFRLMCLTQQVQVAMLDGKMRTQAHAVSPRHLPRFSRPIL